MTNMKISGKAQTIIFKYIFKQEVNDKVKKKHKNKPIVKLLLSSYLKIRVRGGAKKG